MSSLILQLQNILTRFQLYMSELSLRTGVSVTTLCVIALISIIMVEKITQNLISVLCTAALFVFILIVVMPIL